jgi:hypothetical protein
MRGGARCIRLLRILLTDPRLRAHAMSQPLKTSALALAAAGLLLAGAPALHAQTGSLIEVDDPAGDDVGAGDLVYPRDNVLVPGDLDLRSLRVIAERDGLRIDATFRNPIRHPSEVKGTGLGSEDLSVFARRGFYAFNLDLYFDTDRVAGSGNTIALPGRGLRFDPAHAWEKVVVLTPRPELMRRQLADTLTEATPGAGAEAAIDASVHFATDVRVRGRTVSFTVPRSFIDPALVADASLTALVTAAKLSIEADLSFLSRDPRRAIDRLALGAVQPEAGRPAQAMGYRGERAPASAVVDLLTPAAGQQRAELAAGVVSGLNRDNRYGAATAAAATTAAAPAAPPAPAPTGGSWFSRALGAVTGLFGGAAPAATAPAAPAGPAPTLQSLIEPAPAAAPAPAAPSTPAAAPAAAAAAPTTGAAPPAAARAAPSAPTATAASTAPVAPSAPSATAGAPAAPAAAATAAPAAAGTAAAPKAAAPSTPARTARDAAFYEEQELRLRSLQRLRERGLLTEEEYQRKRREIIDAL